MHLLTEKLETIGIHTPIPVSNINSLRAFNSNLLEQMTLLHRTVEKQEYDTFDYLLSQGAAVSVLDNIKLDSPLHYAARIHDRRYVEKLIEHYNAAYTKQDDFGAVSKRQKLLPLAEWINGLNLDGKSALYLAVMSFPANLDLIHILLENGADIFISEYLRESLIAEFLLRLFQTDIEEEITSMSSTLSILLDHVNKYQLWEKLNTTLAQSEFMRQLLMLRNGCSDSKILIDWIAQKKIGLVEFFLRQGLSDNIWDVDESGKTILHYAVAAAKKEIIELLMINAKNNDPATLDDSENIIMKDEIRSSQPILMSEQSSGVIVVDSTNILYSHLKYINLAAHDGNVPLDELFSISDLLCDEYEAEKRKDIFIYLLAQGANPYLGNKCVVNSELILLKEILFDHFFYLALNNINQKCYQLATEIRKGIQESVAGLIPRPGDLFERRIITNLIEKKENPHLLFYLEMLKWEFSLIDSDDKKQQFELLKPVLRQISIYALQDGLPALFLKSIDTLPVIQAYLFAPIEFEISNLFSFSCGDKAFDVMQKKAIIEYFFNIFYLFNKFYRHTYLQSLGIPMLQALESLGNNEEGMILREYFAKHINFLEKKVDPTAKIYERCRLILPDMNLNPHETYLFICNQIHLINPHNFLPYESYPLCEKTIKINLKIAQQSKLMEQLCNLQHNFKTAVFNEPVNFTVKKSRARKKVAQKGFFENENCNFLDKFPGAFVLLVDLLIELKDPKKMRLMLLNEPDFINRFLHNSMALEQNSHEISTRICSNAFLLDNLLNNLDSCKQHYFESSVNYFRKQIATWQTRIENIRIALSLKEKEFSHSMTRRQFIDAEIEDIINYLGNFQKQLLTIYNNPDNFEVNKRIYPHLPQCIETPLVILDQVEEQIKSITARYRLKQFEMLCSFVPDMEEKRHVFTHMKCQRMPSGKRFAINTTAKITPLFQPVPEENFLIVRNMVTLFPELLDVRDQYGRTPLHWAMFRERHLYSHTYQQGYRPPQGSTAYADLLLELGADPYIKVHCRGLTPTHFDPTRNVPPSWSTFFSGGTGEKRAVPALPNTGPMSPEEDKAHDVGTLAMINEKDRKHMILKVLKREKDKIPLLHWQDMYNHVLFNPKYRKANELDEMPQKNRSAKHC